MHSPALSVTSLTVTVAPRELQPGAEVWSAVTYGCTLVVMSQLQRFNMKNHRVTHSFSVQVVSFH